MTTLQLGLIAGGAALVVGVLIYNWVQERRIRRRIAATFTAQRADETSAVAGGRIEPTLEPAGGGAPAARGEDDAGEALARRSAAGSAGASGPALAAEEEAPPVEFQHEALAPASARASTTPGAAALGPPPKGAGAEKTGQPDPDIECVVTVQPARPVAAGALAAGLHARLGKPLRWFGRTAADAPWQPVRAETSGSFAEFCACLLLADRTGAVTPPVLERFYKLVAEIAASLPGAWTAPDAQREVARAEALDRYCANLDVQIGLTVLKSGAATIPGTRLRGVAEAAGFRLSDAGRFEWVQEETGQVLYSLQNYRSEAFTVDNLRLTSTPGAVFILDVPRVVDPVRVFDQMKLTAKRITMTLDATLVDDNRKPLTDAALAAIRQQVEVTAAALKESRLDPGSPRAMALFGG